MIVTQITSGLGNQMFQYAAGFGLAARRGAQVVVDRRFYETSRLRSYELDRFRLSAREITAWDRLRLRVSETQPPFRLTPRGVMRAALRALPIPRVHFKVDAEAGFDPSLLDQPDDTLLIGYWQAEGYFAHCAAELRRELQFKDPPDPLNAEMLCSIAAQPAVCVHVRRTDYLNPNEVLKPCGLDYYARALAHISDRSPNAHYFIFSDDPDWARANLAPPGEHTFVTHNTGKNDPEDLRLMAACTHFIIANSSFSWWGAWLSEAPGKIVIAPSRWFSVPHRNETGIVPDGWVRM